MSRVPRTIRPIATAPSTVQIGHTFRASTTGGDFTQVLPAITLDDVGLELPVINLGTSGTCTLDGAGGNTIDGALTFALLFGEAAILIPTSTTTWEVFGQKAVAAVEVKDGEVRVSGPAGAANVRGHGIMGGLTTYGLTGGQSVGPDGLGFNANFATAAVVGSKAGWSTGPMIIGIGETVRIIFRAGSVNWNNKRAFVGITEATDDEMVDSDDPDTTTGSAKYVGIQSNPADGNWFFVTSEGAGTGQARDDTGESSNSVPQVTFAVEISYPAEDEVDVRILDGDGVELNSISYVANVPGGFMRSAMLVKVTSGVAAKAMLFVKASTQIRAAQ